MNKLDEFFNNPNKFNEIIQNNLIIYINFFI